MELIGKLRDRLRAALDEEERIAQAAYAGEEDFGPWEARNIGAMEDPLVGWRDELGTVAANLREEHAIHIARQDPGRTLARIAAHRGILDSYEQVLDFYGRNRSLPAGEVTGLRTAVKALAVAYGIETWDRD